MVDWHCHLLPGLDDGPIDVAESIAMAARLADFGWDAVCCTPHCIKGYYDLTPQQVREATLMLQADLDNAGIRLELWPGMEYMLDECFAGFADDLLPLGDTRLVLCEAPQQANPHVVIASLERILAEGFVPLIAHPERTEFFYEVLTRREVQGSSRFEVRGARFEEAEPVSEPEVELVEEHRPQGFFASLASRFALRKSDPRPASRNTKSTVHTDLPSPVFYHANLGSFTGFYGPEAQRRAYQLLKAGAYHSFASDLHDSRSASAVLVRDKLETNPLLQRLAGFDGVTIAGDGGEAGQGELF